MKHIVVGDIHGDEHVIYHVLNQFPDHRPLFMGDFLDSFTFDSQECVRALKLVLDLVEDDRADSLIGNHELSYMSPRWRCSGFNAVTHAHVMPHLSRMGRLLLPFIYNPKNRVLFTHAGLSRPLWFKHDLNFDNLDDRLLDAYRDEDSFFHQVGRVRGGFAPEGGPIWCDWSEFQPIEGLHQVSGHSAGRKMKPANEEHVGLLRKCEASSGSRVWTSWNIDCLQYGREFLEYDDATGALTPIVETNKQELQ